MAANNRWFESDGGGPDVDLDPDPDAIPELPEPIYMSTKLLGQYVNRLYFHEEPEELSDGEEGEDENLDLTAPPLESWFHGRISRHTACERLDMVGENGGYLVRESVQLPGDYAISFLSKTGHVHHFKINSNCGNYYIGGRQFFSLSDLIGFYANCSCILENESLEVPIVPPKPVPLYMMLRATSAHTKTPGTDEITIAAGEVFLLLSKLNDDWGWGRSQRTGESGLIPIVILEDVTNEDPNLGKPWFHGSISRDESVDLLMRNGKVGNFLLRKAGSPGGDDEIRYSLCVRTPDKVQRFLITKFVTGYYVFGGRPFNSIEDIIERYKNEVILDGLKLGEPLPPVDNLELGIRPDPDTPVIEHKVISHAGDRRGTLMLRKGKKSPVYGKWKSFYFVVNYKEHKLLYYDHETSHRARGLLDLKQCKVYAVHPSLLGRNDCLVVMLRYLNELSFYYLAAETAENAQEWLYLLRQCTLPGVPQEHEEIQQVRSLSLVVKDCKVTKDKNISQVYSLIFIDGACIGRTRVSTELPCVFDECFIFEDLPPYADTFSCEVQRSGKGRSMKFLEKTLGRINIHFSDLPNGQEDDQWHQMLQGGSRTARGSLRLVANFKDLMILPLDEYRKLKELVLSDDLAVIEALAKVCKDHHAELASTLIQIFLHYDQVIPILTACLEKSIESEENTATLFRASTLPTMLMDQFMKLTATKYLHSILKEPVQQILESPESCELNPDLLARTTDLPRNLERLENHLQHVLTTIFKSTDNCPPTLRYICRHLQEQVIKKWPTDESVRTRAVSGFLFLRCICPALLKPQLFDLTSEPPSPNADRTLKLVAKSVQNIANLVEFKAKERFMTALNPFIQRNMPLMRVFIDDIAHYPQSYPPATKSSSDPNKDLAAIHHLCCTYERGLVTLAQNQAEVKKLLGVMQSLRTAEKKYTNKLVS